MGREEATGSAAVLGKGEESSGQEVGAETWSCLPGNHSWYCSDVPGVVGVGMEEG